MVTFGLIVPTNRVKTLAFFIPQNHQTHIHRALQKAHQTKNHIHTRDFTSAITVPAMADVQMLAKPIADILSQSLKVAQSQQSANQRKCWTPIVFKVSFKP